MDRHHRIAVWLLNSMGIALLALSVVLVPTSALLADSGDNGPLAPAGCLANNGCGNGCTLNGTGDACLPASGTGGCTGGGCTMCNCRGCLFFGQQWFCNCQCQGAKGTCKDNTTCNPNKW
jgi:hypothetical protein